MNLACYQRRSMSPWQIPSFKCLFEKFISLCILYNYVTLIINLSRLGESWNYIEDGLKRNIQDYLTVKGGGGISLAKYQDLAANSLKGSKDQKFRNGVSDYSYNITQFYLIFLNI